MGDPSDSSTMVVRSVVVLGTAQDGGVPQAGCACPCCAAAASDPALRRHPVALGVTLSDGRRLLVEATKALSEQVWAWGRSEGLAAPIVPDMVALTHLHLGHVQGLGEFGTEVMGRSGVPLLASEGVVAELAHRRLLAPFVAVGLDAVDGVHFVRVPHRDEHGDTHALLFEGASRRLLFLPDHDTWAQTLDLHGEATVRAWLSAMKVDVALLDGTFWSGAELPGRDMSRIPHPTVQDTLARLGARVPGDPEVHFTHLNHSNPCLQAGAERQAVLDHGWGFASLGQRWDL